jgi:hypothetical protein
MHPLFDIDGFDCTEETGQYPIRTPACDYHEKCPDPEDYFFRDWTALSRNNQEWTDSINKTTGSDTMTLDLERMDLESENGVSEVSEETEETEVETLGDFFARVEARGRSCKFPPLQRFSDCEH